MREKVVCFCFLFRFFFFEFWAKIFQTFVQKTSTSFQKLPSTCPEEQFVVWNFFLKFWIVLDFLQKPSAWFPKFYLRVQSKNCGRNSFLIFLFRIFSDFDWKFSDSWPKNVKNLSKLPSTCPEEQFVAWNFFLKFWVVLDFLQKLLAWFSKFYLRVQSKNCGKNSFFCFLSGNFSNFERKLSDFWPKNVKNLSKLPSTCPEGQFVAWFFLKFWIVSDFLQKHLARFSKFYLRVQSKNCGKNSFFLFFFPEIFRIWAKYFQTFGQKTSRTCQN